MGSYPVLQQGVYVSLIGSDETRIRALAEEVERETMGRVVSEEEVCKKKVVEAKEIEDKEVGVRTKSD